METSMFRNPRGRVTVESAQRKSKVVSIPVHFINSSEEKPITRSSSAVKIQKVFRGFLVRRSVTKIASIKREVQQIELRICQDDAVELIRREVKERLRLNEALMALLFKLDSVRGVDGGVRELRKAVIRKAIALQERVDAIAAAGDETLEESAEPDDKEGGDAINGHDVSKRETADESGEVRCSDLQEAISETTDDQKMDVDLVENSPASEVEQTVEHIGASDDSVNRAPSLEVGETGDDLNDGDSVEKTVDEGGEVHCPDEAEAVFGTMVDEKANNSIAEVGFRSEAKDDEEGCIVKQVIEDQLLKIESTKEERVEMDSHVSNGIGDQITSGTDDRTRSAELLQRMMEENEKMMSLMTQLHEKNEVQTRMLSSLTRRVEQLERALVCERLRKKKKKRHAAETVDGTVDCAESIPDQKKCGKK